MPREDNPNVLVGFDRLDDAGVYRLNETTALVETVDFFTPIVDDPRTFGEVAAANALSDIYAMGGKPLSALAVTCFPAKGDPEVLAEILLGGLSKMREAGCSVLGGHSVADDEIKFGYAVVGLVDPEKIRTNAGAKLGDDLVVTKRLGTGVISTALKRGRASEEHVKAMIESMVALNALAGAATERYDVHAATDVTGFGLLGHAWEMADASDVGLEIDHARLHWLPGALHHAKHKAFPGGLENNRVFAERSVEMDESIPEEIQHLLYDPQTSGGLLVALSPHDTANLLAELEAEGVTVSKIGRVTGCSGRRIRVY